MPKLPRRQVGDMRVDPPLATVFGSTQAHSDFGGLGGIDRSWRESKVVPPLASPPQRPKKMATPFSPALTLSLTLAAKL